MERQAAEQHQNRLFAITLTPKKHCVACAPSQNKLIHMTTFSNELPIYLQICERIANEILAGTYSCDDRIPSVRAYSTMIQVNVNTAAKAYEQLADDGIIYQRRGMGYYVTAGARDRIMAQRREKFRNNTLQKLFEDMHLLGFTIDDIVKEYDKKRNNPSE